MPSIDGELCNWLELHDSSLYAEKYHSVSEELQLGFTGRLGFFSTAHDPLRRPCEEVGPVYWSHDGSDGESV